MLFALPVTRRFYALGLPPAHALGLRGRDLRSSGTSRLEGWWMIDQRNLPPDERTPRFTPHRHHHDDAVTRRVRPSDAA